MDWPFGFATLTLNVSHTEKFPAESPASLPGMRGLLIAEGAGSEVTLWWSSN